MSDEPPRDRKDSRATTLTLLVVIAVAAIYFINSGALAWLLPDLYPPTSDPVAVATATSAAATATQDFLEGTPETFLTTPTPVPAATAAGPAEAPVAALPALAEAPALAATVPATIDGLPTITLDELPREALDTIAMIESGGPFPYDRDGITFQNREGLLPNRSRGFYREYTVTTPGESDRGARRIVAGEDGALYYTDDHYDSFSVVVRAER
jgi:ribonuclease T1